MTKYIFLQELLQKSILIIFTGQQNIKVKIIIPNQLLDEILRITLEFLLTLYLIRIDFSFYYDGHIRLTVLLSPTVMHRKTTS